MISMPTDTDKFLKKIILNKMITEHAKFKIKQCAIDLLFIVID